MTYRLALNIAWQEDLGAGREALLGTVEAADRAGVHSVWVEEAWARDAFTTLVLIAARTEQIQLGTAIVNVFSRTPAALAQHFATLDEVSGGRAIVGLGSSAAGVIETLHGTPFRRPVARTADYVSIIRAVFAGEPLDYEGAEVSAGGGMRLAFQPPRADVPIYIASLLPRSLRQTAEIADGWLPLWTPLEAMPELTRFVRDHRPEDAEASGREFNVRSPGALVVTDDVERARGVARGQLAYYIARMGDFYARHFTRLGHEELVESVRAAWQAGGRGAAAETVPPDMQQSCWFVTSDIGEARDRLAQQVEAGITLHRVEVDSDDPAEQERILAALGA